MPSIGEPRPRRVLIIVENLPVPLDRRVWSEATTLHAAGYEVSVICPLGKNAEAVHEVLDGINIYRHPLGHEARGALAFLMEYSTALFHEFRLSLKVVRRHGFDVIHACNPPDLVFLIGLFYRLFGKRFLFDHHDLCPELYEAKFGRRGWLHRVLLWCERLTFATATVSLATNESYRQIAVARGRMDPERVFVVRSGPNLKKLKRMPPDDRWKNGRTFLIGYVGVLGQQEGIDLLIQSVDDIVKRRRRTDIQFVIVGGGPELANLRQLAAKAQLEDFVTFTGRIDDPTLLTILSTAEICVNPDRCNEMNDKSTMNKILEYMALEKPIVQFDLAEGRFSAQDASLYAKRNDPIDFADQLLHLLADPRKRAEMGRVGRERVERELSWGHQVPKLLAAYDAVFHDLEPRTMPSRPPGRVALDPNVRTLPSNSE
jgi:glycosyltransferase involved in cell wall biosynthesis